MPVVGMLSVFDWSEALMSTAVAVFVAPKWGFPKIGDPNIVPQTVGSLL